MTPAPSTVGHLDALTGALPPDHGLVLSARSGSGLGRAWDRLVTAGNVDEAVARCTELAGTSDVYVSCTATSVETFADVLARPGRARGGAADARAVVAVWADLDLAGPGHVAEALPASWADVERILADLPMASMVVASGGGAHAWWLLAEPVLIVDDPSRARAAALTDGWVRLVAAHAHRAGGWKLDAGVGDLARVLRVCGTLNHKTARPRRVALAEVGAWPPGLVDTRPWRPGPLHRAEHLEQMIAAAPPLPAELAPRPERVPRPTGSPGAGLNILQVVDAAPWADLWPPDWSYAGTGAVDGNVVEFWNRPGATTTPSAKCWPDGGAYVHSDQVPGLPVGAYSRAEVLAWRVGLDPDDLSGLARALIAAGRERIGGAR